MDKRGSEFQMSILLKKKTNNIAPNYAISLTDLTKFQEVVITSCTPMPPFLYVLPWFSKVLQSVVLQVRNTTS